MPTCCVPGCGIRTGNKYKRISGSGVKITLHRLPKDTELLREFVNRIKHETGKYFQVSKTTSICSTHFKTEDFEELRQGVRSIKRNTLPSIFHCESATKNCSEEEITEEAEVPEFNYSQISVLEASIIDPNNGGIGTDHLAHGSSEEHNCTPDTQTLNGEESVFCTLEKYDAMRLSLQEQLDKEKEKNRSYEADIKELSQRLQHALKDLQLAKEKLGRCEGDLAILKTEAHEQRSSLLLSNEECHNLVITLLMKSDIGGNWLKDFCQYSPLSML